MIESVGNSTIQTLDGSLATSTEGYYVNVFDGTPLNTEGYGSVYVNCTSDYSGNLKFMHSIDNSVWDIVDTVDYPGHDISLNTALYIGRTLKGNWYKTQYTNYSSSACQLRIRTALHPNIVVNDPLNINITQQDLSYVTISGSTGSSSNSSPIPYVWQSYEINGTTTVRSTGLTIHTIHATNFATSSRFVKLYDVCGVVTGNNTPKITLPLFTNSSQTMYFTNGLTFENALQVETAYNIAYIDQTFAETGDVHLLVTYS